MALTDTLTQRAGPLPVWGWGLGAGAVVGIILLAIKLRSGGSGFATQQPQSVTLTPNGGSGGVGGSQPGPLVCDNGQAVTDLSQCTSAAHPGPAPTPTPMPTPTSIAPVAHAPIGVLPIQQPPAQAPTITPVLAPTFAQPYTPQNQRQEQPQQNTALIAQQQDAALYAASKASVGPTWSSLGSGTPATQLGASPYVQQMQLNSRIPGSALLPSTPQQSFEFYNLPPTSRQPIAHTGPGGVVTNILPR